MMKKKKERVKKSQKTSEVVVDSPKTSQRSSGRQRRPVFSDLQTTIVEGIDSESSTDDEEYIPKQGRNARRQAKRSGFILTTHEELSSEVTYLLILLWQ